MIARAALGLAAWSLLAAAVPPDPPPVKTPPVANPPDGTAIKPPRTVDPGIEAKTPPATRFTMPVITPTPSAPPR